MSDIDALVSSIDATWSNWNLWRACDGRWCIQLGDEEPLGDTSLVRALRCASEHKPLPRVPRPVTPIAEADVAIKKNGTFWEVFTRGHFSFRVTRKRDAQRFATEMVQRSQADYSRWREQYARLVEAGHEGVDFRFAS